MAGNSPEEAFNDQAYCALRYDNFADERRSIHRRRYRVLKERLERDSGADSGYEIDSSDPLRPPSQLRCGFDGRIAGFVRLLSSTVPIAYDRMKRWHSQPGAFGAGASPLRMTLDGLGAGEHSHALQFL